LAEKDTASMKRRPVGQTQLQISDQLGQSARRVLSNLDYTKAYRDNFHCFPEDGDTNLTVKF
jgi:hypothetical protein